MPDDFLPDDYIIWTRRISLAILFLALGMLIRSFTRFKVQRIAENLVKDVIIRIKKGETQWEQVKPILFHERIVDSPFQFKYLLDEAQNNLFVIANNARFLTRPGSTEGRSSEYTPYERTVFTTLLNKPDLPLYQRIVFGALINRPELSIRIMICDHLLQERVRTAFTTSYKITEQALGELKSSREISDGVLGKLEKIKNQEYIEESFKDILKDILGEGQSKAKSLVLNLSSFNKRYPPQIADKVKEVMNSSILWVMAGFTDLPFIKDYNDSVNALKEWKKDADCLRSKLQGKMGRLKIKKSPCLGTLLVTFVDHPRWSGVDPRMERKMVLTPVPYQSEPTSRACFYFTQEKHKDVFDYYSDKYFRIWRDDARSILSVNSRP